MFLFLFAADLLVLLVLTRFGFLLTDGDPVGLEFAVFNGDPADFGLLNFDGCAVGSDGCGALPPTAPISGSATESVCE